MDRRIERKLQALASESPAVEALVRARLLEEQRFAEAGNALRRAETEHAQQKARLDQLDEEFDTLEQAGIRMRAGLAFVKQSEDEEHGDALAGAPYAGNHGRGA